MRIFYVYGTNLKLKWKEVNFLFGRNYENLPSLHLLLSLFINYCAFDVMTTVYNYDGSHQWLHSYPILWLRELKICACFSIEMDKMRVSEKFNNATKIGQYSARSYLIFELKYKHVHTLNFNCACDWLISNNYLGPLNCG